MTIKTDTAVQPVFSEGVVFDGAAILRDGVMMTVGEILEALTRGAVAEARVKELEDQKPIAWIDDAGMELLSMDAHRVDVAVWRDRTDSRRFPLYARSSKDGG